MDVLRLKCPACSELFLATDLPYSHPYQTHPNKRSPQDVKSIKLQIRLSPREIHDVGIGKATLTISNNRIQLQYKP